MGRHRLSWPILIGLALALASCGNPYSHKTADVGNGVKTLTLDGSKRSIVAFQREDGPLFFCAEPSPDSMGTLSAAFASAIQAGEGNWTASASGNGTIDTSVISLFTRSQGIQALRDGLYRLCEAFANGAIDEEQYQANIIALTATLNFVVPIEICADMTNATQGDFQQCVKEARGFASDIFNTQGASTFVHTPQQYEMLWEEYGKQQDGNGTSP